LETFGGHWHETLRFGERYDSRGNLNGYVFTYSDDAKMRAREERDWNYIEAELAKLRTSMRELIAYIREAYVELDPSVMSDEAWTRYRRFVSRLEYS
jgi:hypothetical protein